MFVTLQVNPEGSKGTPPSGLVLDTPKLFQFKYAQARTCSPPVFTCVMTRYAADLVVRMNLCSLIVSSGGGGAGMCHPPPPTPQPQPLDTRKAESENMIWHTELRAMKTVVAGAVGANCGEANLTHCGPTPQFGCSQLAFVSELTQMSEALAQSHVRDALLCPLNTICARVTQHHVSLPLLGLVFPRSCREYVFVVHGCHSHTIPAVSL